MTSSPEIDLACHRRITLMLLVIVAAGVLFQFTLLWFHPQGRVLHPDEAQFLANTRLLQEHGLSRESLLGMKGQAFGPLLNIIQALASPLTNLTAPPARIVHLLLFVILIPFYYLLIKTRRPTDAWPLALSVPAIPILWYQSGGIWSQLPAIVMGVTALTLLFYGLDRAQHSPKLSVILVAVAGLIYGLSILARATMLATLACLPLLLVNHPDKTRRLILTGCFGFLAALVSAPVFIIWKGLIPPDQAFVGSGFSIWHMVLNFAVTLLLVLFAYPRAILLGKPAYLAMLIIAVIGFVLNVLWFKLNYRLLGSIAPRVLPATLLPTYDRVFPPIFMGLAFGMLLLLGKLAIRYRQDAQMLFLVACTFVMCLTSLKITHIYSSGYAIQCLPFLVLPVASVEKITWITAGRVAFGIALGLTAYTAFLLRL